MARFQATAVAFFLLAVVLVDFAAQARYCDPPCELDERCISMNRRERRGRSHNTCVRQACLTHNRRGRCFGAEMYHFDQNLLECVRDISGACFGHNRFTSREDCEFSCFPLYRR